MYSIVLMMALSGSAEAPAFCHGCMGCSGCYGGGCSGCSGCHGGFLSGLFSRHGCHGCNGCAGCYGGGCYGGGCYGGGYGCYGGGCYGGYAGGCYGGGYGCTGGMMYTMPPATGAPPAGKPDDMPKPKPKPKTGDTDKKDETSIAAPATIVVTLPADAKLTIDDNLTTSTSASRVFATPALDAGKEFHYTLKAEIVRDGKKLTATERVTVMAGAQTSIALPAAKFNAEAVAQK